MLEWFPGFLATGAGIELPSGPSVDEAIYEAMLPMGEALRNSGHFGPPVEVADDADAQTRLLGFIGRTP